MQAYATAEQFSTKRRLRPFDPRPQVPRQAPEVPTGFDIDGLLDRLADLVVERLMERTRADASQAPSDWLDARGAAEYLGVHRDTLRKLAAERAVPVHQDGPRCKLYFRTDELDDWRRSSRAARLQLRAVS